MSYNIGFNHRQIISMGLAFLSKAYQVYKLCVSIPNLSFIYFVVLKHKWNEYLFHSKNWCLGKFLWVIIGKKSTPGDHKLDVKSPSPHIYNQPVFS